jgi:hypothetical protein
MLLPITSQYVGDGFQLSFLVYTKTVDLCKLKSDLHKIPRATDPKERNYCVNRGVSAGDTISQITGIFTFTAERTSVLQRIKLLSSIECMLKLY